MADNFEAILMGWSAAEEVTVVANGQIQDNGEGLTSEDK